MDGDGGRGRLPKGESRPRVSTLARLFDEVDMNAGGGCRLSSEGHLVSLGGTWSTEIEDGELRRAFKSRGNQHGRRRCHLTSARDQRKSSLVTTPGALSSADSHEPPADYEHVGDVEAVPTTVAARRASGPVTPGNLGVQPQVKARRRVVRRITAARRKREVHLRSPWRPPAIAATPAPKRSPAAVPGWLSSAVRRQP